MPRPPREDDIAAAHRYLDALELALHDYIPLTGSVDVRHSLIGTTTTTDTNSSRIAAVDTNRFPAGFHHVDTRDHEAASSVLLRDVGLNARINEATGITVIQEAHTRMLVYYESVSALVTILERTWPGKKVTCVSVDELPARCLVASRDYYLLNADLSIGKEEGMDVAVEDIEAPSGVGGCGGDSAIIANGILATDSAPTDSGAIADNLANSLSKCVSSTDRIMGWDIRSKAIHFAFLSPMVEHIARLLKLPKNALEAAFTVSPECCVEKPEQRERLAVQIDTLLSVAAAANNTASCSNNDAWCNHHPNGDNQQSRRNVFVKNDSGTYGLGVVPFTSGDELRKANSSVLDKLSYARHGQRARRYVLQEGIPTVLKDSEGRSMEVVLMCLAGRVYSYFVRVGGGIPGVKGSSSPEDGKPRSEGKSRSERKAEGKKRDFSTSSLNAPGSFFVQRSEFESSEKYSKAAAIVRGEWDKYELLGRAAMISMAREALWYSVNNAPNDGQHTQGGMVGSLAPQLEVPSVVPVYTGRSNRQNGKPPQQQKVLLASESASKSRRSRSKKKHRPAARVVPGSEAATTSTADLEEADRKLRRLVGCIMCRVSTQLEGIKGSRIARQRLGTDLNDVRKRSLAQIRGGKTSLEDELQAMQALCAKFCEEMGICLGEEPLVAEGPLVTGELAEEPLQATASLDSRVDDGNVVKKTDVGNATKESDKAAATTECSKEQQQRLQSDGLTGKEVDTWLRTEISTQIQKVESKTEKVALSKQLQGIKKDLLKQRFSFESELRSQFDAKLSI